VFHQFFFFFLAGGLAADAAAPLFSGFSAAAGACSIASPAFNESAKY
jgi:hypothetical protein